MESRLHAKIMRRVYYSYVLSIFTQPMFFQGVFLSVAALLLARWLHVASIVNNFLAVPVGHVPSYIYNSFHNAIFGGELIVVLTLLLAGGVAVYTGYKLTQALVPKMWMWSHIS